MRAGNEVAIALDGAGVERAINAAREDIWSGLHHDDGDADGGYDEDEDGDGRGVGASAEGGEVEGGHNDSDDGGGDGYDGDDNGGYDGLSALGMMGEDFERNSVAQGEPTYLGCISTPAEIVVQLEI
jgi:hypothetical protein